MYYNLIHIICVYHCRIWDLAFLARRRSFRFHTAVSSLRIWDLVCLPSHHSSLLLHLSLSLHAPARACVRVRVCVH